MKKDDNEKDTEAFDKEWFGLLPDAQRAEVLKTQITERELTRRELAAEETKRQGTRMASDGYHAVRVMFVLVLAGLVSASTCVGYRFVELEHGVTAPVFPPPAK